MLSLPPDLDRLCSKLFLQCNEFENAKTLSDVFTTNELAPFVNKLPDTAGNKDARVSAVKFFLLQSRLADGRALLLPFLDALCNQYPEEDALHGELHDLYQRVLAHAQAVASPSPSRAEFSSTGMLQYFDLKPLVDGCMDELPANKPGLFGFAVTTLELSVIKNLGERVKEQLKRGRVRGPTSQKLSENIPISNVVNKIIQQHSAYLEQDHLWSICIVEKQKANDFWRELCQSVADQKLKHRIIVIMGVTPDSALPNDIVRLEWSCFKKADVRDWLLKMSDNEDLQWLKGDELLSATNYILDQRIQDMSDAELVYTCLQEILDSLRENPDDFRQQIEKGV